jgi:hypothetical protein
MWAKYKTVISIAIVLLLALGITALLYRKHVYFQSPVVFLPNPQHFINDNKAYPVQTNDAIQNVAQS